MSKLDILRKLIREEVALAIRVEFRALLKEELLPLLKESRNISHEVPVQKPGKGIKPSNSLTNSISLAMESKNFKPAETGDPIANLLNETAMSMTSNEYRTMINADSSMAPNFGMIGGVAGEEPAAVGTVEQMLSTNRPVSDINQVTIDVVPDFTGLMSSLKSKGAI
jgi:hypothetical protein